ncbi:uncharacterized protein LOC127370493 [Dicentrarchus labrax]|uniref:uncharacterized protein LOC127370493 n=1 Tax=Dicentrarchus labrax TaxID=13489 RepID=UPI0021F5EED0|nr:uncharacterized protein LOC127370493 [Dicentrarchus labrax]
MSQCEDREEGAPPSKRTRWGEHDTRTKAQSPEQQNTADSVGPGSKPEPGPSCLSLKSDSSNDLYIDFKGRQPSATNRRKLEKPKRSSVSRKRARVDQESSEVPSGQSAQQHQTHLDSIFMLLEDNIVTFVKNELKKIKKGLSSGYPEWLESQREDEEVLDSEDEEQRRSSREAFLKITVHFLRRMKQEELADRLQSSKRISLKI